MSKNGTPYKILRFTTTSVIVDRGILDNMPFYLMIHNCHPYVAIEIYDIQINTHNRASYIYFSMENSYIRDKNTKITV